MKTLHYKTFERVIIAAVVLSLLWSTGTPVFAQGETPAEEVFPQTEENQPEVQFPLVEERSVKFTWYVTATAYSSDVWQNDRTPFLPANGVDYRLIFEKEGVISCVALNDLRLGARVRFPDIHGERVFTVCDRTSGRYTGLKRTDFYFYAVDQGGRIDSKIALDVARTKAKEFGIKRKVKMEILDFSHTSLKATLASAKNVTK